jgi:hypothetical protein
VTGRTRRRAHRNRAAAAGSVRLAGSHLARRSGESVLNIGNLLCSAAAGSAHGAAAAQSACPTPKAVTRIQLADLCQSVRLKANLARPPRRSIDGQAILKALGLYLETCSDLVFRVELRGFEPGPLACHGEMLTFNAVKWRPEMTREARCRMGRDRNDGQATIDLEARRDHMITRCSARLSSVIDATHGDRVRNTQGNARVLTLAQIA